jgi:alkaline phosphatase D
MVLPSHLFVRFVRSALFLSGRFDVLAAYEGHLNSATHRVIMSSSPVVKPDFSYPQQVSTLAFGSCHKNKYADELVWHRVAATRPDGFVWTGDAVYAPGRGDASVAALKQEYDSLKQKNRAYAAMIETIPVFGTWDDHDYGGNDGGRDMTDREGRAAAYWEFLGHEHPTDGGQKEPRRGVYSSVTFGEPPHQQVKVILLDTRWHRGEYCLPNPAIRLPLGAGVGCLVRWLSAGLLPGFCANRETELLGEEQWKWLEGQLSESKAAVHVVVSSIQVLTTLPVMESWGHFPAARDRLLRLLAAKAGPVLVLSGDVHFAEISDPLAFSRNDNDDQRLSLLEITSSGLTHHCGKGIYGKLCRPLTNFFSGHRWRDQAFIGRNFGTLQFDWNVRTVTANVLSIETGETVLTTGPRPLQADKYYQWTDENFHSVLSVQDGHLLPVMWTVVVAAMVALLLRRTRRKS